MRVARQRYLFEPTSGLFHIALVSVLSVFLSGCNVILPPFDGGVRVIAMETPIELPGVMVPISNAEDIGVLIVTLGPGSGSSQFDGYTNTNGVDDHPNANANAEWQLSMLFGQSSAPACQPAGPVTFNGDSAGLIWNSTCIVY